MKHLLLAALWLGTVLTGAACTQQDRRVTLTEQLGESPFRIRGDAAAPTAADGTVLIRIWSLECLEPEAPELRTLGGWLPTEGDPTRGALPSHDQIADQLEALDARAQLRVRSAPAIAIMGGESAEMRLTEQVNRPDLQRGVERGAALFPFELGERFRVGAAIDADGWIDLDLDYRLETADELLDESAPQVMTTTIRTAVRLESGQSVVLGGQRLLREVSARRTPEQSVLLLVVNARVVPKTTERRADAG